MDARSLFVGRVRHDVSVTEPRDDSRAQRPQRLLSALCGLLALGTASSAVALPLPAEARGAKVQHMVCNLTGAWRGTGVDVAGTRWRFELSLTQTDTAVEGFFDWHAGEGHDGRERVAGRVDCGARRLALHGVALEHAPALALARYELGLNPAFTVLAGRWLGGVPGTLRATRVPR